MPSPVSVSVMTDDSGWDRFVLEHPRGTVDHLWGWRAIFEGVFGQTCRYLGARRGNDLVGVLPLVLFRSRLFGRSALSLPLLNGGGLLASDPEGGDALITEATRLAREFGAAFVELRHVERQRPELPCRQHKVGLDLALPDHTDELWKTVDRKVRNQVRKARKAGLDVVAGGPELLGEFYAVFSRNMRDLGTPVYPRKLFDETLRVFGDRARVHVVRHEHAPVASGVTLRFRDSVVNPWASSLRSHRHLCPNMLLYWTFLEHAIDAGASRFDFGRSSPGSGPHGFKRQWGARETPLHWEYGLLEAGRGLPDQSPSNPRMRQAIAVWQRLPLPVANWLGPRITAHLP